MKRQSTTLRLLSVAAALLGSWLLGLSLGGAEAHARTTLAVAPLGELGIARKETVKVRRWLQAAISGVSSFRVRGGSRVKRFVRGKPDCAAQLECLGRAASAAGVEQIVAGDVGRLGGGYILYLRLVSAGGKQLRAISGVLDPSKQLRAASRALAFQLLAPERYTGELAISVNVDDAWVYLDGRRVAKTPLKKLPVTVGTHALRLTHEAHRDHVRFVRVEFEQTTALEAKLEPVPVSSRKMRLAAPVRVLSDSELPWYRRWWVVAGMGATLVATTAVVIALIPKKVEFDRELTVTRP